VKNKEPNQDWKIFMLVELPEKSWVIFGSTSGSEYTIGNGVLMEWLCEKTQRKSSFAKKIQTHGSGSPCIVSLADTFIENW
jgi:hypothetical protein